MSEREREHGRRRRRSAPPLSHERTYKRIDTRSHPRAHAHVREGPKGRAKGAAMGTAPVAPVSTTLTAARTGRWRLRRKPEPGRRGVRSTAAPPRRRRRARVVHPRGLADFVPTRTAPRWPAPGRRPPAGDRAAAVTAPAVKARGPVTRPGPPASYASAGMRRGCSGGDVAPANPARVGRCCCQGRRASPGRRARGGLGRARLGPTSRAAAARPHGSTKRTGARRVSLSVSSCAGEKPASAWAHYGPRWAPRASGRACATSRRRRHGR